MSGGIDSIPAGLTALRRARVALEVLVHADAPLLGAGRSHVRAVRSEAVEQATLAIAQLTDVTHEYGMATFTLRILDGVASSHLGARHIQPAALSAMKALDSIHVMPGLVRARIADDLSKTTAWNDPDALVRRLVQLRDRAVSTQPERVIRRIEAAVLLVDAPAGKHVFPAIPTMFSDGTIARSLDQLLIHSGPIADSIQPNSLVERVLHHAISGTWQSEATRMQAAREVAAGVLDPAWKSSAIDLEAILGEHAQLGAGQRPRLISSRPHETPLGIEQATHFEVARRRLLGQEQDLAGIDVQVRDLVHATATRELDVHEWARLRAGIYHFGSAERLGLATHFGEFDTWAATAAWRDDPARHGAKSRGIRDMLLATWRDKLDIDAMSDEALGTDMLRLIERARTDHPAADLVRSRVLGLGVGERLGLQLHVPGQQESLEQSLRYMKRDQAPAFLERWRLQLSGVAGDEGRVEARVRELVRRGDALGVDERVELSILLHDHGAAERLGLPRTLAGAGSLGATLARSKAGVMDRYLRLWQQIESGDLAGPEQAAARTRELLAGPLDTPDQLRALGSAAIDAGGAAALGLPLQLHGAKSASSVLFHDGIDVGRATRLVDAWRARLTGTQPDYELIRGAISDLGSVDEPTRFAAAQRILLHGFDLDPELARTLDAPMLLAPEPASKLEWMLTQAARKTDHVPSVVDQVVPGLTARLGMSADDVERGIARINELLLAHHDPDAQVADELADLLFTRGLFAKMQLPLLPPQRQALLPIAVVAWPELPFRLWRAEARTLIEMPSPGERLEHLGRLASEETLASSDAFEINAVFSTVHRELYSTARADVEDITMIQSRLRRAMEGDVYEAERVRLQLQRMLSADDGSRVDPRRMVVDVVESPVTSTTELARLHDTLFTQKMLSRALGRTLTGEELSLGLGSVPEAFTPHRRAQLWRISEQLDPAKIELHWEQLVAAARSGERVDGQDLGALVAARRDLGIELDAAQLASLLTASSIASQIDAAGWLANVQQLLDDPVAVRLLPVHLRDQARGLVADNLQRLGGLTPDGATAGYDKHPEYAELGQVKSTIQMLDLLMNDIATQPARDAAAGAEMLVW